MVQAPRLQDILTYPVKDKKTSSNSANGLRYGVSGMQGWRSSMEDEHNVVGSLKGLPDLSLFGVYDGHGGSYTSNYISKNLPRIFLEREEIQKYKDLNDSQKNDVEGVRLLKKALICTFITLDQEMRRAHRRSASPVSVGQMGDESNDAFFSSFVNLLDLSGSTCVIVLVTPKHIICANAGDSRACMKRGTRVVPLSFDHKPCNAIETSRIKKAGGKVIMKRVDGDLAVSRGLGDFIFKIRQDLPLEKQKVSCIPDVTLYPRDRKHDQFIVLACDGIWDVMSNEECAKNVHDKLMAAEKKTNNIGKICEEIIDIALNKNSRDNMSIIIVAF